jgi:hypothetical protein
LNGELDISIYDPAAPLTPIPDGTIVTIKLEVRVCLRLVPFTLPGTRWILY